MARACARIAADLDTATENFRSAVDVLDKALAEGSLPPNHPVRVYLRLSQLASLRAWQGAAYEFEKNDQARDRLVRQIREEAKRVVKELEGATKFDPELKTLVDQYRRAIGG